LDLDTKKLEVEKGFMELTKDRDGEKDKFKKDADFMNSKTREEKMLWESEKIELSHKNKL